MVFVKNNIDSILCLFIISHRVPFQWYCMHPLFCMIFLRKDDCEFAQTVGAVVEADHYISLLNCCKWLILFISKHDWLNEFVSYSFVVRLLNSSKNIFPFFTFRFGKQVI